MSDDPAGIFATGCVAVCLELFGGFCLDFTSISKSLRVLPIHPFDSAPAAHACTSRLCPWPFDSDTNDELGEDTDPGERDLLIPKARAQRDSAAETVAQPPPYPTMSQSPSTS